MNGTSGAWKRTAPHSPSGIASRYPAVSNTDCTLVSARRRRPSSATPTRADALAMTNVQSARRASHVNARPPIVPWTDAASLSDSWSCAIISRKRATISLASSSGWALMKRSAILMFSPLRTCSGRSGSAHHSCTAQLNSRCCPGSGTCTSCRRDWSERDERTEAHFVADHPGVRDERHYPIIVPTTFAAAPAARRSQRHDREDGSATAAPSRRGERDGEAPALPRRRRRPVVRHAIANVASVRAMNADSTGRSRRRTRRSGTRPHGSRSEATRRPNVAAPTTWTSQTVTAPSVAWRTPTRIGSPPGCAADRRPESTRQQQRIADGVVGAGLAGYVREIAPGSDLAAVVPVRVLIAVLQHDRHVATDEARPHQTDRGGTAIPPARAAGTSGELLNRCGGHVAQASTTRSGCRRGGDRVVTWSRTRRSRRPSTSEGACRSHSTARLR